MHAYIYQTSKDPLIYRGGKGGGCGGGAVAEKENAEVGGTQCCVTVSRAHYIKRKVQPAVPIAGKKLTKKRISSALCIQTYIAQSHHGDPNKEKIEQKLR